MARKMNEIEQRFYNAYVQDCILTVTELGLSKETLNFWIKLLKPQQVIGVYLADFIYISNPFDNNKFIVEIDGHENHKTKEQREYDYKRERYFQKQGYTVIRFMGTEVFLQAEECIKNMSEIAKRFNKIETACYISGLNESKLF